MTLNFHPDLRRHIESALAREIEAHYYMLQDLQELRDEMVDSGATEARMASLRQRKHEVAFIIVGLQNALDDLRKEKTDVQQ